MHFGSSPTPVARNLARLRQCELFFQQSLQKIFYLEIKNGKKVLSGEKLLLKAIVLNRIFTCRNRLKIA
jgi:hypothetical protein